MSRVAKVYSPKELEGLSEQDKKILQKELDKQIKACPEIKAIINAHGVANTSLKDKLRDTYNRLKPK